MACVQVFRSERPGQRIVFDNIECPAGDVLRIMHITADTMPLGRARVEVDGVPLLTQHGNESSISGYRESGALFHASNFLMPPRASDSRSLLNRLASRVPVLQRFATARRGAWPLGSPRRTVAIVSLDQTDNPKYPGRYGFAIGTIMCVPPHLAR